MKNQRFCSGIYLLSLLLAALSCNSSSQPDPAEIDQLFSHWDKPGTPGAAISVVKDGKIIFKKGYGSANLEYDIPITPSTVFHIASVSKQFTTFAVLLLERDGKLSLDDDVRKYIPEVPDFGRVITLRHLAYHTSGLRDQWSLLAMAGWRLDDVITKEHILKLVGNQKELNFNPGDEYVYCNTGFTLLAEVVARISGKSFAEFTRERIFDPLKMNNTLFYDDHEKIVRNRAYSYSPTGSGYKKSVLNYANAGATSLFTTVEDLSLWAMNFENPVVGDIEIINKMNTRGILNKGDTIDYALGQGIGRYKGLKFISHGGADAGYRSFLGRFPEQKFSVMVFSNDASFNTGGIALKVADLYLGDKIIVPESPKAVTPKPAEEDSSGADPALMKSFCGQYELQPGVIVSITLEGEKLFVEAPGLAKTTLAQSSSNEFVLKEMNARIVFVSEEAGKVTSAKMFIDGQEVVAPRMKEFDPGSVNLTEYTGNFYSPELGTTYTFVVKDGKLTSTHQRLSDFELIPAKQDWFVSTQWFFGQVEFMRDGLKKVIGCMVTNDRVRNLRFEKVIK
jgi:CubicO group peptidase (beta-lactamase class C family)